jgi:hypothetical protein
LIFFGLAAPEKIDCKKIRRYADSCFAARRSVGNRMRKILSPLEIDGSYRP